MLAYRRIGGTDDRPEYKYLIEGKPEERGEYPSTPRSKTA